MSSKLAEFDHAVGSSPDGWRSLRLGDVADISRGTSWGNENECREAVDGALPVLGIRNVQARLEIHDLVWLQGLKPSAILSSTVQAGDILMVGSNGNPARIGNAVQVDEPGRYLYASLLFGVRPRRDDADPDFLYQAIVAPGMQTAISDGVQGTTGLSNLKITTLRDFPIDLPPLDEQRRIAEVMRSVDEAIALARQCEEQSSAVRASLLNDRFHMGDWDDVLALPASWEMPLLDSVAVRGSGHTPNKKIADYWDGGVRWVSLQDTKRLDQVYISETAQQISVLGIANSSAVLHPSGVVVISRDATIGKSAITVGPMAVSQHFISYCCGPKLDNRYLYYWFQRMKPVLERIGTGSTIKTIGLPFFKSLRIALPPLDQQKQVAAAMLDIDQSVMACGKAVASLSKLKAALMSDLLSGRVRVPAVDANASIPTVQPAFKRAVFAAEIVYQLQNDKKFGSVKHEKIVYLCELHTGLQAELDRHAYKEAAGPYDPKARRSVERIFRQQKWFDVTKPDGKRVAYAPMEKAGGHASYFDRYFGSQREGIQSIIDLLRPLNTERCEIVATLYAVWNDLLIDGRQPTDDEIVSYTLQWHPKKREIEEDRWRAALPWMRQKGLVPRGVGEKTRVAQE